MYCVVSRRPSTSKERTRHERTSKGASPEETQVWNYLGYVAEMAVAAVRESHPDSGSDEQARNGTASGDDSGGAVTTRWRRGGDATAPRRRRNRAQKNDSIPVRRLA